MVFSSMVFLWVFLPIVFVLSRIVRKPQHQNILLLIASLIFYAWGEPVYILVLLFSIFMNWAMGMLMETRKDKAGLWLIIAVAANLGILGYYKYANFFLNTLDHLLPMVNLPRISVTMPIGISFFTFQAMSYVIDLYRGEYKAQKNPLYLALYVSFFPQLIAGPIVRYVDIEAQVINRTMSRDKTSEGIRRFIYGLGKKVIIANTVASSVDTIFGLTNENMTGLLAWAGALLYALQIYYDFSGYSDMAIGLGKMFGFEFLENFNYPYLSRSIAEFWRRWHISLGTWFREYLYIPLGGNRKGKLRTYINLGIVFALTGLWHGASWNFVGWGLYHGFFSIIERLGWGKVLKKLKGLNWIYTFLVVIVGWVFFRVESVRYGLHMLICMLLPWKYTTTTAIVPAIISSKTITVMIVGIIGMGLIQQLFTLGKLKDVAAKWKNSLPEAIYCILVLFCCIMLMANNAYNPFIYFRF